MSLQSINFQNKFSLFKQQWSFRTVAEGNGNQFKLLKIKGGIDWHVHPETDEVLIVLQGSMEVDLPNGKIILNSGEMFVIPKGTDHKAYAAQECELMVVEPGSPNAQWI